MRNTLVTKTKLLALNSKLEASLDKLTLPNLIIFSI